MKKIKSEIVDGIFFNDKKVQKSFDDYISDDFVQDAISKKSDYILNSINDNIGCMFINNEIVNGKVVCKIYYQEIVESMFDADFWLGCLDIIENKLDYSFDDDDISDDFEDNLCDYMLNKYTYTLIEYCKDIIKIEIK